MAAVENGLFPFVTLVFDLSLAHRVFIKVLAPVLGHLCSQEVTWTFSFESTLSILWCQNVRWVILSSVLVSTERLEYLGLISDTDQQKVILPPVK